MDRKGRGSWHDDLHQMSTGKGAPQLGTINSTSTTTAPHPRRYNPHNGMLHPKSRPGYRKEGAELGAPANPKLFSLLKILPESRPS